MEEDLGWYALGVISALIGASHLDHAASGGRSRPLALIASFVASYLAYQNWGWLSKGGDAQRLIAWSLAFCASSPVLGLLWWGRGGAVRRVLLRLILFVVCLVVGLVLWPSVVVSSRLSTILSLGGATLVVLPWRAWAKAWKYRQRSRRSERPTLAVASEAKESMQVKQALAEYRTTLEGERRERAQLAERLAVIEAAAVEAESRVSRRREEIAEQVRLVREAEIRRVKSGHDGLRFHEHFGFLMAEAWRVLRAEIAAGERFPALEHDAFFAQVLADLLAAPDFEERYFHAQGRAAIEAVNAYLLGREALETVLEEIRAQNLRPELLAPKPLQGELAQSLVESWLVPHRRLQRAARERFLEGEHPRREELLETLAEQGIEEEPSFEQWRCCWDALPELFVLTENSVEAWSLEERHGAREIRVPREA